MNPRSNNPTRRQFVAGCLGASALPALVSAGQPANAVVRDDEPQLWRWQYKPVPYSTEMAGTFTGITHTIHVVPTIHGECYYYREFPHARPEGFEPFRKKTPVKHARSFERAQWEAFNDAMLSLMVAVERMCDLVDGTGFGCPKWESVANRRGAQQFRSRYLRMQIEASPEGYELINASKHNGTRRLAQFRASRPFAWHIAGRKGRPLYADAGYASASEAKQDCLREALHLLQSETIMLHRGHYDTSYRPGF